MGSKLDNINKASVLPQMRPMPVVIDEANEKIRQAKEGLRSSYITRWTKLNDAIDSIQECEIFVIGGRPGSGKSAVLNLLVQDIFDQHLNPYPTLGAYLSLEMPAYQQIIRYYSNSQQIESKKILSTRNPITDAIYEDLLKAGEGLKGMNILFYDIPLVPEAIGNTIIDMVNKNPGVQIILVIDHSRLVIGDALKEEIKIRRTMEIVNHLKNDKNVHLITILLSQMNRDIEKERDRRRMGQSLPVMADLFGASAIEQYATTVILLHRPEMYGLKTFNINGEHDAKDLLIFNVAKQRNGWTGAVLLRSKFQYYDIHDGNTVVLNENGVILNFVN